MTCAEFCELAPAFVLGSLDPDELVLCREHLAQQDEHDGCLEAIARAEFVQEKWVASLPRVEPSDHVWGNIEEILNGETKNVVPLRRPARRWISSAPWLVAAAAAVLLFWQVDSKRRLQGDVEQLRGEVARLGEQSQKQLQTVQLQQQCESRSKTLFAALQSRDDTLKLLENSQTRIVPLASQKDNPADARAMAIVNLAEKRAVVVAHGLVPTPGKDFELWVIRGNQKMPVGLLRGNKEEALFTAVNAELLSGGADAVAITIEPEGGSPQPTGPIILVAALPKA